MVIYVDDSSVTDAEVSLSKFVDNERTPWKIDSNAQTELQRADNQSNPVPPQAQQSKGHTKQLEKKYTAKISQEKPFFENKLSATKNVQDPFASAFDVNFNSSQRKNEMQYACQLTPDHNSIGDRTEDLENHMFSTGSEEAKGWLEEIHNFGQQRRRSISAHDVSLDTKRDRQKKLTLEDDRGRIEDSVGNLPTKIKEDTKIGR